MIQEQRENRAFTLIEVLLTAGLFSLLFYLASVFFSQIQKSRLLDDNLWQIAAVLRQAQNNAASGEGVNNSHFRFGILFSENYYQEFATLSDYSNRDQNYDLSTTLPSSLRFSAVSLPDNCLQPNDCLIFFPISATPSASGQVSLEEIASARKRTIYINEQGQVSF